MEPKGDINNPLLKDLEHPSNHYADYHHYIED
jgi:hypothetical protein